MMKTYNKYILFIATGFLTLSSCSDILDTEPKRQVSSTVALTDITGIRSLLISAYDRIQSVDMYGRQMALAPDVLADNLRVTNNQSNRYIFIVNNQQGTHMAPWGPAYLAISDVNSVIASIDGSNTTAAEKATIKGEALFLRSLCYFDLARVYGYEPGKENNAFNLSVILRLTPTNSVTDADLRPRSTNVEIYTQIETDLKAAISLLNASTTSAQNLKANKAAAMGLLARLYLYWGKYSDALNYANQAIATTNATLYTSANLVNGWKSGSATAASTEALFEVSFVQATESLGTNDSPASLVSTIGGNVGFPDLTPTNELYNLYEANDLRRQLFYDAVKSGENVKFTYKYSSKNGAYTDNVPVIRMSEMHLIRMECKARLADATALTDLNTFRASRGASPRTSVGNALIEDILTERRLELVYEGHRWFDLKRLGRDITKAGSFPTVAYTDIRILAPLPAAQITLNPSLKQNPGY